MKVLEIETFGRGGLTHYAYNLSEALAERGHQVTLVTTAGFELEGYAGVPLRIEVVKPIGRATSAIQRRLTGLARRLCLQSEAIVDAVAVAALTRRLRPDVIHLHCTNPVALVYLAVLGLVGRPIVYTAHIVTPHEPIRFQKLIYSGIHGLSRLIVAHSDVDRARLLDEFRISPERVTVIPHGEYGFLEELSEMPDRDIARRSLGIDAGAEVVLFFGYIREYKGLDLLLDAWPRVAAERPLARLVIAGDPVNLTPARRDQLEAWAERVGALHRLEYIPFQEVGRYFSAADVLAMPYRRISQSGVLFLALALGVPLVATRVGALPEMLTHGDSAMLVPAESTAALADALTEVLGDDELWRRLARGGRRVAAQHHWGSIAERTERAFETLNVAHRETN